MRNAHCNTVGHKIWQETLKKLKNGEMYTV